MSDIIRKRLDRWQHFFNPSGNTRRMLIVSDVSDSADRAVFAYPMYWPENRKMHTDWTLHHYADLMRHAEWLDDDSIPYLSIRSGTEIFAECFGCPVYRAEDNMPFALHAVQNAAEAKQLSEPSLWDSPLRIQFELADAVRAQEPDAILGLPDLQSPLDIAALIWEKSDFYCALVEEPEAVHELCDKIYRLLTAFLDAWFERYGTVNIAHYPDYPLLGGVSISEDEVGAISESLFEEYALPYLNQLSARYGSIGIHCCANSRHQWGGFKKVNGLKMINLVQPQRELVYATSVFAGVAQWPMGDRIDEAIYQAEGFKDVRIVEGMSARGMGRVEIIDRVAEWRALHSEI